MSEKVGYESPEVPGNTRLRDRNPCISASTSLEEHSYCLSFPNLHPEERDHMNELFVPTSIDTSHIFNPVSEHEHDVYSPVGFSVELSGDTIDTNFDGFNFTEVQVGNEGSSATDHDLGNMWGGGGGGSSAAGEVDINTVEVNTDPSPSDPAVHDGETNLGGIDEDRDLLDLGENNVGGNEKESEKVKDVKGKEGGLKRKRAKRNKYPLLIKDVQERKAFFEISFRKLTEQLQRLKILTKCEGELSAFVDGKIIVAANATTTTAALPKEQQSLQVPLDCIDDHRYAATMITQSSSSPGIRDHQYNQQILNLDGGSDSWITNPTFIEGEEPRDQTFSRVARNLFLEKRNLQDRTGYQVKLFLKYGDISVNDKNFEFLPKLVKRKRGYCFTETWKNIAPAVPVQQTTPVTTFAPLTLIIPNLDGLKAGAHITDNNGNPDSTASVVPARSDSDTFLPPEIISSIAVSSSEGGDRETNPESFDQNVIPIGNGDILYTHGLDDQELRELLIETESQAEPRGTGCEGGSSLVYSSFQTSPPLQATVSRGMKDSSTNTEPICSICLNQRNGVNRFADKKQAFWIRCNEPFCHDMVHAACVGFMITHSAHLKQLPAFYCESHR